MTVAAPQLIAIDPHPDQLAIIQQAARFNVVDAGRRYGKSELGLQRSQAPLLKRGLPVGWFSPSYRLLTEVWREAKQLYLPITRDKSEQEHRLELTTDGVFEFWSLDSGEAGRSRKYARILVDEAALVENLTGESGIWELALRPTLTDFAGDAWFFSTPRGLNGFWKLYQWGQDPLQPDWRSWKRPSAANPYLPAEEIDKARDSLPERAFAQEYLAEFLNDGAGVFRNVLDCATAEPGTYDRSHVYVAGVDFGRVNDFTVISVIDATARAQVALDRFTDVDYSTQRMRLGAMAARWHLRGILAEANSMGGPLWEALRESNLPVYPWTSSNATKAEVVQDLALALEQQSVSVLRDAVQSAELLAYDQERLPSGLIRYGAPSGQHDDTVIALALAWQMAQVPTVRTEPTPYQFGTTASTDRSDRTRQSYERAFQQ